MSWWRRPKPGESWPPVPFPLPPAPKRKPDACPEWPMELRTMPCEWCAMLNPQSHSCEVLARLKRTEDVAHTIVLAEAVGASIELAFKLSEEYDAARDARREIARALAKPKIVAAIEKKQAEWLATLAAWKAEIASEGFRAVAYDALPPIHFDVDVVLYPSTWEEPSYLLEYFK